MDIQLDRAAPAAGRPAARPWRSPTPARDWLAEPRLRPGLRCPAAAPAGAVGDRRPAGQGAARRRDPRRRHRRRGHGGRRAERDGRRADGDYCLTAVTAPLALVREIGGRCAESRPTAVQVRAGGCRTVLDEVGGARESGRAGAFSRGVHVGRDAARRPLRAACEPRPRRLWHRVAGTRPDSRSRCRGQADHIGHRPTGEPGGDRGAVRARGPGGGRAEPSERRHRPRLRRRGRRPPTS